MEIEVGEYVRLKSGLIGQFYNIEEGYDSNIQVNFEEFGYEYENIEQFYEDIKLHSKIISEIIEEGDYVNGLRVEYITNEVIFTSGLAHGILFEDIRIIVTKEQMASIEYKVYGGRLK